MAIKRLDPSARFRVISQMDEAVVHDEKKDRYQRYLENFDQKELSLKDDVKPTYFILRPLKNLELADINAKYLVVNPLEKTARYQDNMKMFLEMFDMCCEGTQVGEDGPIEKVKSDDIPLTVASEIGSIVSLIATLGKNLKKA